MRTSLPSASRPSVVRVAMAALFAATLAVTTTPVMAQESDLDTLGAALVNEFIHIVTKPDEVKRADLTVFLAEEFQIVRSDDSRLDKPEYLLNPASITEAEISDVHTTEAGGVLVVSYTLSVSETLDGVEQTTVAPRLSVFHQGEAGAWQIAAHANFGALPQPE